MCIATPLKIIEIKGKKATVEHKETKKEVDISLIQDLKVGDWIIATKDLAINKVPEKEAKEILKLVENCQHEH